MIFLTTGTQLPFDRLVEAVDLIAPQIDHQIFGQIGKSKRKPVNFESTDSLSPKEFKRHFECADIIVAHAGIGTILSGLDLQKTLVLMARKSALGEHRNDHQVATIRQMRTICGIYEATDKESLLAVLGSGNLNRLGEQSSASRERLISAISLEIA